MSRVVTVTCDSCGSLKSTEPEYPWWAFQYTSTDFPTANGNYQFKSGSWDLCDYCSRIAYEALVKAVGSPGSHSDPLA